MTIEPYHQESCRKASDWNIDSSTTWDLLLSHCNLLAHIPGHLHLTMERDDKAQSGPVAKADQAGKERNEPTECTSRSSEQSSSSSTATELPPYRRSSIESTATDLPPYRRSSVESTVTELPQYDEEQQHQHQHQHQQSARPPSYNDSRIYAHWKSVSDNHARPEKSKSQPFDATTVNAVLSTSSSSTDRMHSPRSSSSNKVNDWSEDPTYKSRLSKLAQGSSRKWNYFGADIGSNPFRSSSRK